HFNQIFLLVPILGTQDFVDDVAIARQQNQAFRILVEPSHRKHAARMIDRVDDVAPDVLLAGAGNAHGFVVGNVHVLLAGFARRRRNFGTVDFDARTVGHFETDAGDSAVDRHATFGDQAICFAARAEALFAQVFVQTHGTGSRRVQPTRAWWPYCR